MKIACVILAGMIVMLAGCHRSEPPVDLVKTQRETLNQAKAVQGQVEQAQERLKAAEEAQK